MAIGIIGNDKQNNLLQLNQNNKYNDETYIPRLSNENDSRSYICQNIKKRSSVLDVGCSTGYIGIILKKELLCKVDGIEVDSEALEFAKNNKCYENLYEFNICDEKESEFFFEIDKKYDYIVFSDVLEHLNDPAKVLYKFIQKLKSNGKILISIPNIAHYDIVDGLLNTTFNYSNMGILDSTHLRFFTKYSFAEYIDAANKIYKKKLDCKLINQTKINPYFIGKYEFLDKIINKNKNLTVLQNIFELKIVDNTEDTKYLKEIINENKINITNAINNTLKETNDKILESKKQHQEEIEKTEKKHQEEIEKIGIQHQEEIEKIEKKHKNQIIQIKKEINNNLDIINKKTVEYEELQNYYSKLQSNFDYIYNEYNKTINSRSWRITKTLRSFENVMNEIKTSLNDRTDKKQSILFLVHSWINIYDKSMTDIGGTTLHVLDIINEIKDTKNCYVLTIINNMYCLVVFENNKQKIYDLNVPIKVKNFDGYDFDFLYMINSIIENMKIDLMHIHHLIGFPCDLHYVIQNIKTIMTIHDYTLICSNYFLLDNEGKICNKNEKKCSQCTKTKKIDYKTRDNGIKNIIKNIDNFIFPDESILIKMREHLEINKYTIIPHGIDFKEFEDFIENKNNNKKIFNVAFVGLIDGHKGGDVIYQLISKNNNNNSKIQYHLFGLTSNKILTKNRTNYFFHGGYNKKFLPKLLSENKIDLVLLLSKCPETFSYTLSEISFAKIPVMAYDIGAIANRIKKDGIGWTMPLHYDYKQITDKLNEVFKDEEYTKVLNNLKKHQNMSIQEMVKKTVKLYEENYKKNTKEYNKIDSFVNKFYLKYEI